MMTTKKIELLLLQMMMMMRRTKRRYSVRYFYRLNETVQVALAGFVVENDHQRKSTTTKNEKTKRSRKI